MESQVSELIGNSGFYGETDISEQDYINNSEWSSEVDPENVSTSDDQARESLRLFFTCFKTNSGNHISETLLFEDRNLTLIKTLRLKDCIDFFYEALEENKLPFIEQTRLFLALQRYARSLRIPRHHSGGLLLVWLRICCGIDV